MLKQASIAQYKTGAIERDKAHLVVAMRYYPRFLRKEMRDEFVCWLAPEPALLKDFNNAAKTSGDHNRAFAISNYEERFQLSDEGKAHLMRLATLSKERDVYLACVCRLGEMCHREILLLLAKQLYGTAIGEVFHSYPTVLARAERFRAHVKHRGQGDQQAVPTDR